MIENEPPSEFEQLRSRYPDAPARNLMGRLCADLLAGIGSAADPPIKVRALASLRGINHIRLAAIDVSGMLSTERGAIVLTVNSADAFPRRRFTALHEIGHTLLPGFASLPQLRCATVRATFTERMADIAATELLLPAPAFRRDIGVLGMSLRSIEAIARMYIASIEATALRAIELAEEPVMLQVYRADGQDSSPNTPTRLRLLYSRTVGLMPPPRPGVTAPPESPIGRAWRDKAVDQIATPDEMPGALMGRSHVTARRYGDRVFALIWRGGS